MNNNLILRHGGYHNLITYRLGNLIYEATAAFCERYISRKNRTYDQMVQTARSGVANIIEGSEASATSKKTELKLTNVAKASQEELLYDYLAFLKQNNLLLWAANAPENQFMRTAYPADMTQLRQNMGELVNMRLQVSPQVYTKIQIKQEVACNVMVTLINQETFLLRRQIIRLATDFEQNGGFTERLYCVRRNKKMTDGPGQ